LYYVPVHDLAQKLCHFIRDTELLHPGDRVGVAVSGGLDSVALLRLLFELRKELGIVLSVVHLNHKLRAAESDVDADFVGALAHAHKLQCHSIVADVAQHAAQAGISIETAARELRYKFFRELLGEVRHRSALTDTDLKTAESHPCPSVPIRAPVLDKIATGHTLDDQAETVLMRIIRGTGLRGLRAIQLCISVETDHGPAEIVRPLLQVRRRELQMYLNDIGQSWREDATNRDPKFTRNRVRHVLMPLLESEFNPAIKERLAELAEIARGEEEFWENEADGWLGTGIHRVQPHTAASQLVQLTHRGTASSAPAGAPTNVFLDLAWLLSEETAVQRRIIRAAADEAGLALDFHHVEDILHLAAEAASTGKELLLPGGWRVVCSEDALEFAAQPAVLAPANPDYELRLKVPGEVAIAQISSRLQAVNLGPGELPADANPEHLFDPALLAESLTVRNWRPGDRFWPAHTKSAKKIKELLQQHHVPQADRGQWPVVLSGDEVIWVRGFPGRANMRPAEGKAAVWIREQPFKPALAGELLGRADAVP
jgi:tRNA(Ile)-lysidine synthase